MADGAGWESVCTRSELKAIDRLRRPRLTDGSGFIYIRLKRLFKLSKSQLRQTMLSVFRSFFSGHPAGVGTISNRYAKNQGGKSQGSEGGEGQGGES
jgi:hypothetical protein